MVVAITILESHTYISPVGKTAEEQLVFLKSMESLAHEAPKALLCPPETVSHFRLPFKAFPF